MKSFLPLADIAKATLFELGEQTTHKFEQALYHAMQCVKQLNRERIHHEIKTIELQVSPAKTAKLPADYVDYLKVGVVVGDKVATLRPNKKLAPANKRNAQGSATSSDEGYYFHNYFVDGENKGRVFGASSFGDNPFGEFKIDEKAGLILFGSETSVDCVLLEYQTNGLNPDGSTCVHPYLEQAIINYIKWKLRENRKDYSMGEKANLKQEWLIEKNKARSIRTGELIAAIYEATRSGTTLAVKG